MTENRKQRTENRVTDLKKLLNDKFPKRFLKILKIAGEIAQDLNFKAYLVGGPVRDMLLGEKNIDVDIAVEGNGIKFAKVLASKLKSRLTCHSRFGTSTIFLADGNKLDIATARREKYPYPGSLPKVVASIIKEDLKRRDFTINAMAIKINSECFGELVDYFGGLKDLNKGKIKILHDRSFIDDPTRILRAIRFEQRYNFSIQKDTLKKLTQASRESYLTKVTPQRIISELKLIFEEENPKIYIKRLAWLCCLKFIYPIRENVSCGVYSKRKFSKNLYQLFDKVKITLDWYDCYKKREIHKTWLIYFLILMDGLKLKDTKEICKKFNLSKENSQTLLSVKEIGDKAVELLNSKQKPRPSEIYQTFSRLSEEALIYLVAKSNTVRAKRRMKDYQKRLRKIKLSVNGNDLKAFGLTPGPSFNKILQETLLAKIDGKVKNKKEEVDFLKGTLKNL